MHRDVWTLKNKSSGASKAILASWVSKSLAAAFTESNIKSGFRTTGIWPYNSMAMEKKMGPSKFYNSSLAPQVDHEIPVDLNDDNVDEYAAMEAATITADEDFDEATQLEAAKNSESELDFEADYEAHLKAALAELEPVPSVGGVTHYFVPPEGCSAKQVLELGRSSLSDIDRFLVLPQESDLEAQDGQNVPKKTEDDEPMIDYNKFSRPKFSWLPWLQRLPAKQLPYMSLAKSEQD